MILAKLRRLERRVHFKKLAAPIMRPFLSPRPTTTFKSGKPWPITDSAWCKLPPPLKLELEIKKLSKAIPPSSKQQSHPLANGLTPLITKTLEIYRKKGKLETKDTIYGDGIFLTKILKNCQCRAMAAYVAQITPKILPFIDNMETFRCTLSVHMRGQSWDVGWQRAGQKDVWYHRLTGVT